MNVPNKITLCRIILSIFLLVLIIFPLDKIGVDFPEFKIANVIINSKYLICGIIFMIASLTDFLDGYLARKYNLVTDLGKVMDAIKKGMNPQEAYDKNIGTYGRFADAVKYVDPRKE